MCTQTAHTATYVENGENWLKTHNPKTHKCAVWVHLHTIFWGRSKLQTLPYIHAKYHTLTPKTR